MDVFDELWIRMAEDDNNFVMSFQNFSSEPIVEKNNLHNNPITSEDFQPPMLKLEPRYAYPYNSEAVRIWNECKMHEVELESKILRRLYRWAAHKKVLHTNVNEEVYITWTSPSNILYSSTWKTFQKWFLCACKAI